MIGKGFFVICATFGLVAGSCFEFQPSQKCPASFLNFPMSKDFYSGGQVGPDVANCKPSLIQAPVFARFPPGPTVSVPFVSGNFAASGSPFVCDGFFPSGSAFAPAFAGNGFPDGIFLPSDNTDGNFGRDDDGLSTMVQGSPVAVSGFGNAMMSLSSPVVPAPSFVASKCFCTKTMVKPQIYQRVVTVPRIHRYLKRTVTPVIENFVYKARPVSSNCDSSPFSSGSGSLEPSSVDVSQSSPQVFLSETSGDRTC